MLLKKEGLKDIGRKTKKNVEVKGENKILEENLSPRGII